MDIQPQKILIIQTAFLGDAILATSVAEELHYFYPQAKIFLLVKKGNEDIFQNHPFLTIWTHDKSRKISSLVYLIKKIRREKFDVVINLHRYLSSSILTVLSGAKFKISFTTPLSFLFNYHTKHHFQKNIHEIHRYHQLIKPLTKSDKIFLPKLYPDESKIHHHFIKKKYVCLFPGSIWATKQLPPSKWIELIQKLSKSDVEIYLCGSKSEEKLCEYIRVKANENNVFNMAGKFSLSEILNIIQYSKRIYCNDSAPLHIASALNVPVTAFFCSTVTDFGFYPLSEDSQVIEVKGLECRPCGVHGYTECPQHHFKCGLEININEVEIKL